MLKAIQKRGGTMLGLFGVMLAAGGAALWAQTSSRPTVDASMTLLVDEIRQLREAVERSSRRSAGR
jgi:hypothetical protein